MELDKRQELIHIFRTEGITIKEAADRANINYSTAKHILKTYKQTGMVETTQMMRRKLKE